MKMNGNGFIKSIWEVKITQDFDGSTGSAKLTKGKEYIVYELKENCWILGKTKVYTKYLFLDDSGEYKCCTADCNIQKAFDFKNGKEQKNIIISSLKIGCSLNKSANKSTKEKSNKELFGI